MECKKAQPKEVMLPANLAKTRTAGGAPGSRGAYGKTMHDLFITSIAFNIDLQYTSRYKLTMHTFNEFIVNELEEVLLKKKYILCFLVCWVSFEESL